MYTGLFTSYDQELYCTKGHFYCFPDTNVVFLISKFSLLNLLLIEILFSSGISKQKKSKTEKSSHIKMNDWDKKHSGF